MPENEFEVHKRGYMDRRLEKPKQLMTYARKLFDEINLKQYHFKRDEVEVEALSKLSKADVISFFLRYIASGGPQRRKLSVRITSRESNQVAKELELLPSPTVQEPEKITDIHLFKAGLGLYPLVTPYMDINPATSKL